MGVIVSALGAAVLGVLGVWQSPSSNQCRAGGVDFSRTRLASDGMESHIELDPNVIYAGWPDWVGFTHFMPDPWRESESTSSPRDIRAWAIDQGGFELQRSEAKGTLIPTAAVTVAIDVPIVETRRVDLPIGKRLMHPTGGRRDVPTSPEVHLDMQGPDNSQVEFSDGSGEAAGTPLVWTLARDQVEVFRIMASSSTTRLYQWTARMPVLLHGKRYIIKS
jgi:hypothetical protein